MKNVALNVYDLLIMRLYDFNRTEKKHTHTQMFPSTQNLLRMSIKKHNWCLIYLDSKESQSVQRDFDVVA